MNKIPYDIEVNIWKMVHELEMQDVYKELKKELLEMNKILSYFQKRVFYPYLLWGRLDEMNMNNAYCKQKIDRYVHYKKFAKCIIQLVKPVQHIIYL